MIQYKDASDLELVPWLSQGDESAFTELYRRYSGILYNVAYRMIGDGEECNDIVHEIFSYLWRNRDDLCFRGSISSYLYKATRNKVLNHITKNKHHDSYVDSLQIFMNMSSSSTDDIIIEKELTFIIDQEILKLPNRMKAVFELSRNEYLSYKDIAVRLNISEETVRKQMHKALKILRSRIIYAFILFFFKS